MEGCYRTAFTFLLLLTNVSQLIWVSESTNCARSRRSGGFPFLPYHISLTMFHPGSSHEVCFNDSPEGQLTGNSTVEEMKMTVDMCNDYCYGFSIFGIREGKLHAVSYYSGLRGWHFMPTSMLQQELTADFNFSLGIRCFCGRETDAVGALGLSKNCNITCPGNSSQICGGLLSLSLYSTSSGCGEAGGTE